MRPACAWESGGVRGRVLTLALIAVVDIALDCGFASVTSFSERFRRRFGVPPARFRKIGEARQAAPGVASPATSHPWRTR